MTSPNDLSEIEPGQEFVVDSFRPEDAPGVANLFRSVYGEGYPIETFINPDKLIEENAAKRTVSSVARTVKGDVVGHNALYNSCPYEKMYESGAGLVHRHYRGGKGIFRDLYDHGLEVEAKRLNLDAVFGESVCNHPFAQKMVHSAGGRFTALEVDLMPAAAYVREKSAAGRVSNLLFVTTLTPSPHRVYLPGVYARELRRLYTKVEDQREMVPSVETAPAGSVTRLTETVFDFAQVARVVVNRIGTDFIQAVTELESALKARGLKVFQIWMHLTCPWIGQAVDDLRRAGYFTGGLLPRWFDQDGLLMQKTVNPPVWENIQVFFDEDRELFEFVKADSEVVA